MENVWSILPTPPVFESGNPQFLSRYGLVPVVLRAIATQLSLSSVISTDSPAYKTAWLLLNMRHTLYSFSAAVENYSSDSGRIDVPSSILGITEWYLDLISEVLDDLTTASAQATKDKSIQEVAKEMSTSIHFIIISHIHIHPNLSPSYLLTTTSFH